MHLFRPADPTPAHLSPSWKAWRGLLIVAARSWLAPAARLAFNPGVLKTGAGLLVLVGLVVQIVLMFVVGYLIDLSINLMDLWAELARKHLELTM